MSTSPTLSAPANALRVWLSGSYRWRICGLLFFATTINYIDRQVISILKPTLMHDLGWNEINYSNVVFAFQCAYAIGYVGGGWFMDRVGVKVGYAAAVLGWSLAAMGHTFARSVMSFSVARFALGLAEGGNFPAAIKIIGEWFPKTERALATGLFNAGCNVAVIVTPLLVPWITLRWGWPATFFMTGLLGVLWLVVWQMTYRSPEHHPRVSPAELAHIQADADTVPAKIPWLELLRHRQTWSFTAGIALVAPVWWFYLFWVPGFLHDKHGLNLEDFGPPLVTIYLLADVGSVGGGWLSSWLLQRGWSLNAARKTAMLVCALCVVPVFAAATIANLWVVSGLIGLAAAAVAGMGAAKFTGYVLHWTGSYVLLFGGASCAYLVALLAIHVLNPRLEPMNIVPSPTPTFNL